MKTLPLLLLSLPIIAQDTAHIILHKQGYTIDYSRRTATPRRVDWVLTKADDNGFDRTGVLFRPDKSLPKGWYVATNADYVRTGFDKGHLCPSADKRKATFILSNIAPQAPQMNRGNWKLFEAYCREQAAKGYTVTITAGVCDSIGTIAHGHITVPGYFWKVVKLAGGKANRTLYTLFPNTNEAGAVSWPTFTVSPERLRAKTGIDL